MSLILDALSRAERDRRREEGPAPDILSDHGIAPRPSAVSLVRALGVALLIAIATGAALWPILRDGQGGGDKALVSGQGEESASADTLAPPSNRTPATSAADSGPRPGNRRERPGLQRSDSTPTGPGPARTVAVPARESINPAEIASLYERSSEQPVETNTGASGDAVTAAVAPAADRPVDTPAEPAPGTGAVTRDEEPIDLERVLRQARSEAAASRLSEHPVPLLQTLNKQYRDRVPTLMYLRHDYNPAGTSVVLINGQTLNVGDRSRGVEVREILADSVILRFEEREFRLRALNSWVNL